MFDRSGSPMAIVRRCVLVRFQSSGQGSGSASGSQSGIGDQKPIANFDSDADPDSDSGFTAASSGSCNKASGSSGVKFTMALGFRLPVLSAFAVRHSTHRMLPAG
jgi:hypothetical protein